MILTRPVVHEFRVQVPDPIEDVFAWHERPGAFTRLAPPWQPVRIIDEADNLADGTAVIGLPAGRRWVAQHLRAEYTDGRRFADRLESRPFVMPLSWHHHHDFESGSAGTLAMDRVSTTMPRRIVERMFIYRHRQLIDDLAAHREARSLPRRTIGMTGTSGLVGSALAAFLSTGGHRVIRLVRHPPTGPDERWWEPHRPDPAMAEGLDAVIHLAGHSIAGRFTAAHTSAIRDSRVEPTRLLVRAAAAAGVDAFISASAIGVYGTDHKDTELDENSAPGRGFLATVVSDWERAVTESAGGTMRVVLVRTGIVQSPRGGALRLQRPLFGLGLGGPMGSGRQWVSWIGIDDLVDIYHRALMDPRLIGPVNAVAPHPVEQRQYAAALGRAMRRPTQLRTPSIAPRLLLGSEGAKEVALASQRVLPTNLHRLGHQFRFPDLEDALRHVLGTAVSARAGRTRVI